MQIMSSDEADINKQCKSLDRQPAQLPILGPSRIGKAARRIMTPLRNEKQLRPAKFPLVHILRYKRQLAGR